MYYLVLHGGLHALAVTPALLRTVACLVSCRYVHTVNTRVGDRTSDYSSPLQIVRRTNLSHHGRILVTVLYCCGWFAQLVVRLQTATRSGSDRSDSPIFPLLLGCGLYCYAALRAMHTFAGALLNTVYGYYFTCLPFALRILQRTGWTPPLAFTRLKRTTLPGRLTPYRLGLLTSSPFTIPQPMD